jgi:hypothetical protein
MEHRLRRLYCVAGARALLEQEMTKREATAAAKALQKRLRGGGWRIQVWENLGWHYAVTNKYIRVSPWDKKFYAMPVPSYSYYGYAYPCFTNPNGAVQHLVEHLEQYIKDQWFLVNKMIHSVE